MEGKNESPNSSTTSTTNDSVLQITINDKIIFIYVKDGKVHDIKTINNNADELKEFAKQLLSDGYTVHFINYPATIWYKLLGGKE